MHLHVAIEVILIAVVSCSFQEGVNFETTNIHQKSKRRSVEENNDESLSKNVRLPRRIMPNSYRLKLQPFPQDDYFQGQVEINITCLGITNRIVLHAHEDLQVDRENLFVRRLWKKLPKLKNSLPQGNQSAEHESTPPTVEKFIRISKVRRNFTTQQYKIILARKLKKGAIYKLKLSFSGKLANESTEGFYSRIYRDHATQDTRWFLATNMKMGNARHVFPCFDEPKYKASFEINVVRPKYLKSVSTMPVLKTEPLKEKSEWECDHFHKTPPMATISLVVIIFNPESLHQISPLRTQGKLTVNGFAQAHIVNEFQDEMDQVIHIVHFLEKYLNTTFPLPQLNLIALPHISSQTAENFWGVIMFEEAELTIRDLPWQLLYALSSQWIGHLVTPHWWTSMHTNNALAGYLSLIGSANATSDSEYRSAIGWKPDTCYELYNDFSKINTTKNPNKLINLKYEWTITMLSHALTENTFKEAIRSFMSKRAFKTFKEDNLWNTLDNEAWKEHTLDTSMFVRDVVATWVSRDRYPVVTVTRDYGNNSAQLEQQVFVRRWPYAIPGQGDMLWWIPIMYLTQDNLDVHNISSISWMREEKYSYIENLPGPDSFIIVNPDDIGMFIVNYDPLNWKMLSEYLVASGSGDGQPLIPTATRAKLLHNAWYLALGGRVDFATALNMTLFLSSESELLVWKAMAQVYFTVSWKLIGTQAETKFDRFIGEMLIPLYESVVNETLDEYHPQAEVVAFARYVLCKAGYKEAVERARVEYEQWLEEPKEIDGGLLWGVFRWVDADWESGLQRVLDLLHNDTAPGFRGFLLSQLVTSTIQPHKVERVLRMLLIEEEYIFPNAELKAVFAAITDSKTFLQFITKHWADVKKRLENKRELWQNLFEQATKKLKTQQGYDMVLEFYKTHKSKLGSAASIVQHSLQVIEANKEGTYKNLPALGAWLDNYLASSEANDFFFST